MTQSADEIAGMIRAAILGRHSIRAVYEGRERLLCRQMLGRNREGSSRVLCLQVGGESVSGLRRDGQGDWRCLALDKFSHVERAAAGWPIAADGPRQPNCIDRIEVAAGGHPEREPQ